MAKSLWFAGLLSVVCGPLHAQNQTINGNLTVTGSIEAAGPIDSGDNTLTFGTQGSGFGGALLHQDNSADTFTFFSNRNPASWLWQHTVGIAAMRLDANHQLILYQSNSPTPGITFNPGSTTTNSSIKLGTHANGTLTADANGVITTSGGFSVAGNFTNANASALTSFMGSVGIGTPSPQAPLDVRGDIYVGYNTAGSSAVMKPFATAHSSANVPSAFTAGLSDGGGVAGMTVNNVRDGSFNSQSIAFWTHHGGVSAGTRMTIDKDGNVGVGTTSPNTRLTVGSTAAYTAGSDATVNGRFSINNGATSVMWMDLMNSTPDARIQTVNNGSNGGGILLQPYGGNVGIGTTNPQGKLHINQGTGAVATRWGYAADDANYHLDLVPVDTGAANVYWKFINHNISDYTSLVLNQGNVGIGTTEPDRLLTISGSDVSNQLGGSVVALHLINTNAGAAGRLTEIAFGGRITGKKPFAAVSGLSIADNSYEQAGSLVFSTKATTDATYPLERMRIQYDGNVGIGTTTPAEILHISSNNGYNNPKIGFGQDGLSAVIGLGGNYLGTGSATDGNLVFRNDAGSNILFGFNGAEKLRVTAAGNVGIGTINPSHKLAVAGTIRAQEIIVDNTNWADYVFEDDYRLAPLAEVESHIKAKKHLPGIPSVTEVTEHGVSVGEMQKLLLQKIEEMTLHQIAQEKRLDVQASRIAALEDENRALRNR